MKPNELEKAVLGWMLADRDLKPCRPALNFDVITVNERELTGVGFLTEFEKSEELKLFDERVSLRWGRVGARLNAAKIETGYLVYVDNGYISTVEGYTYGDEWPDSIEKLELYDLHPGMELHTTPKR